jgi:hypothetical protein
MVFETKDGIRQDLLIDGLVDEPNMGRLSRNGWFTADHEEGIVNVRVRFGPDQGDTSSAQLEIGPEAIPPRPPGNEGAGDIPLILFCETEAPGMDEYPPDQRTHHGGEYYPTIIEEPPFDHVVWINPDSKEALRVRQARGGSSGRGSIGTKTFLQFVALKCFEILKRLKVRQEIRESAITEVEFRQLHAQAEMDCAAFIDEAYNLAEELYRGNVEDIH